MTTIMGWEGSQLKNLKIILLHFLVNCERVNSSLHDDLARQSTIFFLAIPLVIQTDRSFQNIGR